MPPLKVSRRLPCGPQNTSKCRCLTAELKSRCEAKEVRDGDHHELEAQVEASPPLLGTAVWQENEEPKSEVGMDRTGFSSWLGLSHAKGPALVTSLWASAHV